MKMSQIVILILVVIAVVFVVIQERTRGGEEASSVTPTKDAESINQVEEVSWEGEPTERYSARVDRVDVVFEHKDYTKYRLQTNGLVRTGELNTERGFADDEDATVYVLNWQKPEGEQIRYVRLTSDPTHLYNLDSNLQIISGSRLALDSN